MLIVWCCVWTSKALAEAPESCAGSDSYAESTNIEILRKAVADAEQAVERLQSTVQNYKSLLPAEIQLAKGTELSPALQSEQAGMHKSGTATESATTTIGCSQLSSSLSHLIAVRSTALSPFQHRRHRLVAHGLLKWTDGFQLQVCLRPP